MTVLSVEHDGVDVVYEDTEFRLDRELIERATDKEYVDVTDHEILQIVEKDPKLTGEPRLVRDILQN